MQLRNVADHLATTEAAVTDCDLILYAINGLDSSCNPFVSSFTMRSDEVTFDEFHCQLLTYEQRLEQQNSHDAKGIHQANISQFVGISFKN